ncbi:hypothetical protein HDU77_000392 [Chytriomyces hyalinus]|nr:hypothetical protein HDU77_000392 [Chytriomyces hyalinus]
MQMLSSSRPSSPTGERPASGSNTPHVEPSQAGAEEELGVGTHQTTHQSNTPRTPTDSRTTAEAKSSSRAPGNKSLEHGKALLKALTETAARNFEGIVKGSACQLRSAKTPPSDSGNYHDKSIDLEEWDDHKEETDNAKTELASSDVEEEHLGAPLTGGPLKPRQSSGSLDLQVSGLFSDPEKTAFDIFYKFLEVGQSHVGAFQSVVLDPVERMGKLGDELGLTDDVKLINKQNQQFSDDYVQLFNTKKPSDTMINGFSAAVLRFPSFLELECLKNAFDESKLAPDVPASMKLQYILQHASWDVHSLLGRIYRARCDGQYGRSKRDTKLRVTNLESMLLWLRVYCQEKRSADFTKKGKKAALAKGSSSEPGPSSKAKGKSVVRHEEGTFEQIVRFLLRSNKPLLSKHENSAQKGRDAAMKLAIDNADKQGDKKKATGKRTHEDDDDDLDDNGEGTSEKKPRKKSLSAKSTSPKDAPAAQTVKYGGRTWQVPKDFFDLMVKRSMLKEEADEVIIVDDD